MTALFQLTMYFSMHPINPISRTHSLWLVPILSLTLCSPVSVWAATTNHKPVTKPVKKATAIQPQKKQQQQQQKQGLLMRNAVLAAIKKHPLSTVGAAQQEVGKAYRDQANALFAGDPSYNITYRTDQLDGTQGYREFEGSLDFPMWRSGQKNARHKLANSLVDKSKTEQLYLKWVVSGQVLERAWALKKAQMEVTQARVQQRSARKLEADVKRRVAAGEIARGDLLLAQQSTAQTDLGYQQAIAKTKNARVAWEAITGYKQLPVDLHKQSQPKQVSEAQHPHTLIANARIRAARATLEDVRKQRRTNPTLSLYAKRDRGTGVDPFNNSLGVGVSLPFGTKSSSAPRLAEANATVVELVAAEAEIERSHQLEIQQARLAISNARTAFTLAKKQSQLAQSRWKLSKRAFQLGESDLFLVIRAREQADTQMAQLKRNQLEMSLLQARLNHVLGVTPL